MNIWYGCYDNGNFGDHLPNYILPRKFGYSLDFIHPSVDADEVHVWCGSVLRESRSNWICHGLGFGDYDQKLREKPKQITSVRGKLTKIKLLEEGVETPDKYWDICEWLPEVFNPTVEKEYKIGYLPHYRDYAEFMLYKSDKINVIDILGGVERVVTEALKCEKIISTSLHGLILADVYSIPREWRKSKQLESDFKFHDYFSRYD